MDTVFSVEGIHKHKLICNVSYSRNQVKSNLGVLLLHGFGSNKNNKFNTSIVPILKEMGIASCRFDFEGHGESEGETINLTISSAAEDTLAVYSYFLNNYLTADARCAVAASSFGGSVALRVIKRLENIRAIFLRAPVSDYEEVRRNMYGEGGMEQWLRTGVIEVEGSKGQIKSGSDFLKDVRKHNTYEEVRGLNIPTRVVHGTLDDNVPVSQSVKLTESIGSRATLRIVEGAGHGFSEPIFQSLLIDDCLQHFRENLIGG